MGLAGVTPVLRGAFEATGSPAWIMQLIRARGIDRRHGFRLELVLGGDRVGPALQATEATLAAGEADLIDTDWISVARCRQQGLDLVAVHPYGRIMGGVVVPAGSPRQNLAALRDCRVGVVRRLDKNWAVVRAACLSRHGFDPQAAATVVEAGSKTVLLDWLNSGAVDAAVLYWHLVPALVTGGRFRQLCDVLDLLPNGQPGPPTTFFTLHESFVARNAPLVAAFVAAYREGVAVMRADPGAWPPLSLSPEAFTGLRAAWKRRICADWQAGDVERLGRLFEHLKSIGGTDALGVAAIPPGTFAPAFAA